MTERKNDKRKGERVRAMLPLAVEGLPTTARDVSASGVFIETDASYALGSPVNLALDLDSPWGRIVIHSEGKIVRVEHREDRIGVAVQFVDGAKSPGFRPRI